MTSFGPEVSLKPIGAEFTLDEVKHIKEKYSFLLKYIKTKLLDVIKHSENYENFDGDISMNRQFDIDKKWLLEEGKKYQEEIDQKNKISKEKQNVKDKISYEGFKKSIQKMREEVDQLEKEVQNMPETIDKKNKIMEKINELIPTQTLPNPELEGKKYKISSLRKEIDKLTKVSFEDYLGFINSEKEIRRDFFDAIMEQGEDSPAGERMHREIKKMKDAFFNKN